MRDLLPRLFFSHFRDTSLVARTPGGALAAFAVAFRSQSEPDVGYVHFVGVSPALRGNGIGTQVYSRLFAGFEALGCTQVGAVTSPLNIGSIAFHTRLGFATLASPSGAATDDGVPYWPGYDGPGEDRVRFARALVPVRR